MNKDDNEENSFELQLETSEGRNFIAFFLN